MGGNCFLPGSGCTATNTGDFIRNAIFGTRSSVTGLSFYVNNLEKMRISSIETYIYNDLKAGGNFYTYGPSYLFGNFNLSAIEGSNLSGTACLQARDLTTTSNIDLQIRTKKGANIVDVMRLTQDGNVGIGTLSPQQKLHVVGNVKVTGDSFLRGHLFLNALEGDGMSGIAYLQARDVTTTSNIDLQFRTKKAANIVDVMRLTQDGNVGIGTITPETKLSVVSASENIVNICNSTGNIGANIFIAFSNGYNTNYNNVRARIGANFDANGAGRLTFCTGGSGFASPYYVAPAERMRIDEKGNVGIGTTTPTKGKLHIRGSLHIENEDGTAQVFHVSAGKQLVFVGDSAYIMYNKAVLNGENNFDQTKLPYYNNYSLWVSHGIVTEDIVLAKPHQWDDYVFNEDYKLQSLPELEKFVKTNKHLPNMPSETDLKQNGYTMHQMNRNMVKTMEELTLHVIEQEKNISGLNEQAKQKDEQIQELKSQLNELKTMAKDIEALKAILISSNNKH